MRMKSQIVNFMNSRQKCLFLCDNNKNILKDVSITINKYDRIES